MESRHELPADWRLRLASIDNRQSALFRIELARRIQSAVWKVRAKGKQQFSMPKLVGRSPGIKDQMESRTSNGQNPSNRRRSKQGAAV